MKGAKILALVMNQFGANRGRPEDILIALVGRLKAFP